MSIYESSKTTVLDHIYTIIRQKAHVIRHNLTRLVNVSLKMYQSKTAKGMM